MKYYAAFDSCQRCTIITNVSISGNCLGVLFAQAQSKRNDCETFTDKTALPAEKKKWRASCLKRLAEGVTVFETAGATTKCCCDESLTQGSHAVLKVLNCEIGFEDLENVLHFAKMYMKYWKSMEIPNSIIQPFVYSNFALYRWWQFCRCFLAL